MSRYRTPAKGETKSSHNESTHSVAHSSLGLSAVDCAAPTGLGRSRTTGHQRGFREIIFLSYRPRQEAKAWPGLPALASPTLMAPVHQNSQQKTLPRSRHSTVYRREPQAAVGHRVGGIIMATFSFAFSWSSTSKSFILKCLSQFCWTSTKENCKSLKPVSVHYRNMA